MPSDDHNRAKLQQTTAAIKAWTGFVADVARIEEAQHDDGWRLSLTPHAPNACPIEIRLRTDQRVDLGLDGKMYPDCRLASLDEVLPLIEAVVDGQVIRRRTSSAATGLLREDSFAIKLAGGSIMELGRNRTVPDAGEDATSEIRDKHFLPYRRG